MLKKSIFVFILIVFLCLSCKGNQSDPIIPPVVVPCTDGAVKPIVIVHGISGLTTAFIKFYEYFAGMGYNENWISAALLPRINTGSPGNLEYAWYTPSGGEAYNTNTWLNAGNYKYNLPALKDYIDTVLTSTGACKVNLIAHSNGTFVARMLLGADASYSQQKISKVIFVSGAANVSGGAGNTHPYFLKNISSTLPSGIDYYSVTSDSDYLFYSIASPILTLFDTDQVTGAVNYQPSGLDHMMVFTRESAVKKMYEWITGNTAGNLIDKTTVSIGGRAVSRPSAFYLQSYIAGITVKLEYFDASTGNITSSGQTDVTTGYDGAWSFNNVQTDKNLKISLTDSSGRKAVYFLAEKVTQNSKMLNLSPPFDLGYTPATGEIYFFIFSNEFFSNHIYKSSKPATQLTGSFDASAAGGGTQSFTDTSLTVTNLDPLKYSITFFTNNTGIVTDTNSGGSRYRLGGTYSDFNGKEIVVTSTLNSKTVKVKINGNDASNKIVNWIFYPY